MGRGRESALFWSLEKFQLKDQEAAAPVRSVSPIASRAGGADGEKEIQAVPLRSVSLIKTKQTALLK